MFRQYLVIFRELVFITSPSYVSISIAAVGDTVTIIEAQQAKICNNYKNTRLKVLKMNTVIWFNRICKIVLPTAPIDI